MNHILKDSGERQEFGTGAVRDINEEKGRYDLVSPIALRRLALVLERGAKKYEDRNWEKGIPLGRSLESAIRHIYQFIEGHREEDHLGQAMCNLMFTIHTEEMVSRGLLPVDLNNLPDYVPEWGGPDPQADEECSGCPFCSEEIPDTVAPEDLRVGVQKYLKSLEAEGCEPSFNPYDDQTWPAKPSISDMKVKAGMQGRCWHCGWPIGSGHRPGCCMVATADVVAWEEQRGLRWPDCPFCADGKTDYATTLANLMGATVKGA